jgi:hypothetical protein
MGFKTIQYAGFKSMIAVRQPLLPVDLFVWERSPDHDFCLKQSRRRTAFMPFRVLLQAHLLG